MSDDQSNDESTEPKNYRRPPVQHQFQPGQSGNPRGRPSKPERSITPRQLRRDIISVAEKKIPIKTADGIVMVTATEAVLLQLLNRALQGNLPAIKHFQRIQKEAVLDHYKIHEDTYSFVEMVEHSEATAMIRRTSKSDIDFVNSLRRRTRRF